MVACSTHPTFGRCVKSWTPYKKFLGVLNTYLGLKSALDTPPVRYKDRKKISKELRELRKLKRAVKSGREVLGNRYLSYS